MDSLKKCVDFLEKIGFVFAFFFFFFVYEFSELWYRVSWSQGVMNNLRAQCF